jgi:hypothetical protein
MTEIWDVEYDEWLNNALDEWMTEQERAYEEWILGQPEDSTRYAEEEDWSEDDFPR